MAAVYPLGASAPALPDPLVAGGKARGLAALAAAGYPVPDAIVIAGNPDSLSPASLAEALSAIGPGPYAVRSSAQGEDGVQASYAGQFSSFLNLADATSVQAAMAQCHQEHASAPVGVYEAHHGQHAGGMAVVVQQMVDAAWAGVVFTADPVSQRRDRIVIDVVQGLGEALVSGQAQPDHFVLTPEGGINHQQLAKKPTHLPTDKLARIAHKARSIEAHFGHPLDLEWAIDKHGALWWLQARPITTLAADPNELDIAPPSPGDLLTRCNIGEVMPGAVTPLTLSTTGWGIDHALQAMMVAAGAARRIEPEITAISSYFGHLFINLTTLARISGAVLGSEVQQIALSICGQPVPALKPVAVQPLARRLKNAATYFRYIMGAARQVDKFEKKVAGFGIDAGSDAATAHAAIDAALPMLGEAYDIHMRASAGSGAATGALHRIFAAGGAPSTETYAHIARLFAALGDLEGTHLIDSLGRVTEAICSAPDFEGRFVRASNADALQWLRSDASGPAGQAFRDFLADHGARAFRELEMRQQGWRDDPLPLMDALRSAALAPKAEGRSALPAAELHRESRPVRMLVRQARNAVTRRERTKALLVGVTDRFKKAYRALGNRLAEETMLADADLIFFLTHDEIGRLIAGEQSLALLASARRTTFEVQQQFQFDEIIAGRPEPLAPTVMEANTGMITGNPVSAGVAEGPARVALTPQEAALIEPGDILIAPITDIGWTPYFRLIAGLATDIGSSVSHGAVIAREYGLPAIVNTGGATRVLKSGDYIRLDATRGTIEVIEPKTPPAAVG